MAVFFLKDKRTKSNYSADIAIASAYNQPHWYRFSVSYFLVHYYECIYGRTYTGFNQITHLFFGMNPDDMLIFGEKKVSILKPFEETTKFNFKKRPKYSNLIGRLCRNRGHGIFYLALKWFQCSAHWPHCLHSMLKMSRTIRDKKKNLVLNATSWHTTCLANSKVIRLISMSVSF